MNDNHNPWRDLMMLYYAGIGSRSTPNNILVLMSQIATKLERKYILRSGGADGADEAFASGVINDTNKHIYLPWPAFNGHTSELNSISPAAYTMAEHYHPAWNRCSQGGKKLHARNCYQMLGHTLDQPCTFVLCWTTNGQPTGGTGQALRIAQDLDIPIMNMYNSDWLQNLRNLVN